MDAMLALEQAIGVSAGDFVDGGFDTGFFASGAFKASDFEFFAFSPAEIHAFKHASPVHGFGATNAGSNAKNSSVFVKFAGEAEHFFQLEEVAFERRKLLFELLV